MMEPHPPNRRPPDAPPAAASPARRATPAPLLFAALLLAPPAHAALPLGRCPFDAPPADAVHPEGQTQRLAAYLGERLRRPVHVAVAASVERPCVTAAGLFIPPGWLAPVEGPPPTTAALAQLAWLTGLQHALFDPPPAVEPSAEGSGPAARPTAPELVAADLVGCVLAQLDVRGDERTAQLLALEASRVVVGTAPRAAEDAAWRAAVNGGLRRCGG